MPKLLDPKNKEMLIRHKVFNEAEIQSRCEIMLENYCKTVNIEGMTMVDMVRKDYLPAIEEYLYTLARAVDSMKSVSENVKCRYEISTIEKLTDLTDNILTAVEALEEALAALKDCEDIFATSEAIRDSILPSMNTLRGYVDAAEMLTSAKYWPYPSYGKLLFSVQ